MNNLIHRINKSLTFKLVLAISALVLCGGLVFWYVSSRIESRNSITDALSITTSLSELTKRSLRYDMLTAQRHDIQRIVENIGRSGAIEGLDIISMDGITTYSTDIQKLGQPSEDEIIRQELAKNTFMASDYQSKKLWFIRMQSEEHYRELVYIEPIINEPDCSNAACHAHQNNQEVLGFLKTDFSLLAIDKRSRTHMIEISLYLFFFVAIIALVLSLILWHFVIKPVSALDRGMKKVSAGDLNLKVSLSSDDEIGRLALSFNKMTQELKTARQKLERWNQSLEEEVKRQTVEIKRTQDKLIQAEKLAALGRLSADIAHEIRNPLTALGGFGRRLLKLATTEKQREYAEIVVTEVDRLEKILRDILTFSREAKMNFVKEELGPVVEESIEFLAEIFNDHAITITFTNQTSVQVLIDKAHIRQAVNNLILNAIDAMPQGGALNLTIGMEQENDISYAALHITDSGPGIPEEHLARIFEPFYTGKPGHGTGLGLPISQKIIEEHGGMIKVRNMATAGCRVSLYFPYQSEMDDTQVPCWEFMHCGRENNKEVKCPANPHFGRICWAVAGTLCAGKVQGTFAQKIATCRQCAFYLQVKEDSR